MITAKPVRAAALGALLLVPALLVGCAGGAPDVADPTPDQTDAPPSGPNAADLDYGLFFEPEMLDDWAAQRDALATQADAWAAACEPADTVDPNGECNLDLQQLVRDVNGLKQTWLTFDNSEWDDTSLSGMVALKPTRDATLAASESGGTWLNDCAYSTGGEECTAEAEAFVSDVEALNTEFAAWPY